MMPLPRYHIRPVLFFLLIALLLPLIPTPQSRAQEAPAPEAPANGEAAPPAQFDLRSAVENFWHYGKIGRYDLAVAMGQQILNSGAEPADVLVAFEAVSSQRKDNLDQWILRWQNVREMQDVTTQLINVLERGRRGRSEDPSYIRQNIDRLSAGERPYSLAISRLRNSGEVAVPFLLEYLRDPQRVEHHAAVRRALRDMGRYALAPMCAATEMTDWDTLVTVANVLGDLGYDAAAPYLARLTTAPETPVQVKAAAADALARLGVRSPGLTAADLFFDLAEKLYYDRSSINIDNRIRVAYIWYWSDQGLIKIDAPQDIFHELMSMRASEYALRLGGGQGDALSLWLAANYKREVELPQGAVDATRLPDQPDAHYYGVVTGSQYLNNALARTIRDRNAAVSMRIIASLQEIVGHNNMFSGAASRPLIAAMQYPDRLVRYEAAFALAGALPQQRFDGQEMVVPLLGEALSQTGEPTVFIVMPSQDQVNALVEGLRAGDGIVVEGATTPEAAVASAAQMPAIDVFVVSEDIGANEVDRLFAMLRASARLQGAARLVMTQTGASRYEELRIQDPLMFTTTAREAQTLRGAIEQAREQSGSLPMDREIATQYATRAGSLLWQVALSRGQVYDISAAKTPLLASLNDDRPQIVMLGGGVLGLLNDPEAQVGLLNAAQSDAASDEVRISLYNSLAVNAKFFGNRLDRGQTESLQQVVSTEENLDVRSAAAEAHGALNLPADQAKDLILDQSRVALQDVMRPNAGARAPQ